MSRLLDPALGDQHELFKKAYANILYQFGLLNQRAEVLKYLTAPNYQLQHSVVGWSQFSF